MKNKILTVIAIISMFSPIAAFAQTATVSVDWYGECGKTYFGILVNPNDPISVSCDLNGDGRIDATDFGIYAPNSTQIQVPATSTPVTTLPAIDTFVDPSNVGIPSGGGGMLPVGTVICSPFASTCGVATVNGWFVYPNPSWNQ